MKHILCYGDSNTFGHNPEARGVQDCRYPINIRWPGVLQRLLGGGYRVIEEGLNGRTTSFPDPTAAGRSGLDHFYPILHSHQPLDLVIIMLGTNDTKAMYGASPRDIGKGMEQLVKVALNPFSYSGYPVPQVLVVSPILIGADLEHSTLAGTYNETSILGAKALAEVYRQLADAYGCRFLDAARYAEPSPLDSIHLDAQGHGKLAEALSENIRTILPADRAPERNE